MQEKSLKDRIPVEGAIMSQTPKEEKRREFREEESSQKCLWQMSCESQVILI